MPTLPNSTLSRAILLGTSQFRGSADLQDLPAVRRNLTDLRTSLTNAEHGVLTGDNCATVVNPRTPQAFMSQLRKAAREANDFLLVYYAGHGVRHSTRDELYLTLRDTDTELLNATAVPLDWVKEEIAQSPALKRLLVLDCCYSGLAVGTMSAAVIEQRDLEVRGSAVIASAPRNAKSHSPTGRRHTAFTGELITLLEKGSPIAGEPLTVMTLFNRINAALANDGFPKPMIETTGNTSDLLLRKEPPRPVSVAAPSHVRSATPTDTPAPTPFPAPDHESRAEPEVTSASGQALPDELETAPAADHTGPAEPNAEPAPPSEPRHEPPTAPRPAPEPVPRNAAFWAQVVILRILWIGFALLGVMFLSGLIGLLFADPAVAGDGTNARIGGVLTAVFGVLLFWLRRRWPHVRGGTAFSRSLAVRIVLALGGVFCLAMMIGTLFADYEDDATGSAVGAHAALLMVTMEGVAACGYLLFRGRRTPS